MQRTASGLPINVPSVNMPGTGTMPMGHHNALSRVTPRWNSLGDIVPTQSVLSPPQPGQTNVGVGTLVRNRIRGTSALTRGVGSVGGLGDVQIQNLGGSGVTGGNAATFYVGDVVKVSLNAMASGLVPGQPVTYSGTIGQTPFGPNNAGVTDANNNFVFQGAVPASLLGEITEHWMVGNVPFGTLQFMVMPVPTIAPAPTPAVTTPPVTTPPVSTAAATTSINNSTPTATPNWFTDPTQDLMTGVANWELLAGGVVGLVVLMMVVKGKK